MAGQIDRWIELDNFSIYMWPLRFARKFVFYCRIIEILQVNIIYFFYSHKTVPLATCIADTFKITCLYVCDVISQQPSQFPVTRSVCDLVRVQCRSVYSAHRMPLIAVREILTNA